MVNNDTTDRILTYVAGNGTVDASPTDSTKALTLTAASVSYAGSPGNQAKAITFTGTGGILTNPNVLQSIVPNNGTGTTQVVKDGSGVWKFTGLSTTTDFYSIRNGTLIVNNVQNGGVASNLGQAANTSGFLLLGSLSTAGTLRLEGSGGVNDSTDRLFTLGQAGGTLDSSGADNTAFNFTNAGAITMAGAGVARTLTLTGSSTGTLGTIAGNRGNTFAPSIADATTTTFATTVTKDGAGTWDLTATNTYTGSTNVLNGILVAGNNNAFGSDNTGLNFVNAVRLGNTSGTNNASVYLDSTAGRIVPNNIVVQNGTSSNTLTLGALNTTGTNTYSGNVILGATTNTGRSAVLAASNGGTTSFTGHILANGTDTTAGIATSNLSGAGTATITLNNTSSYAGGTTVNANTTLVVGGVIDNANNVSALGKNVAGNTVSLSGGTLKFGAVNSFTSGLSESYMLGNAAMDTANVGTLFATTTGVKLGQINTAATATRTVGTVNDAGWGSNETWVYKGQFKDPTALTGLFAFAKSIDDGTQIKIDGNIILNNQAFATVLGTGNNGGTGWGTGVLGDGWHDIEVRLYNGTGGAGAVAQGTGWTTIKGFGLSTTDSTIANPNGGLYSIPVDGGAMTVFRTLNSTALTTLSLNNNVSVTADSTVDAGSNLTSLTLGTLTIGSNTLTSTGAAASPVITLGATTLTGNASFAPAASTTLVLGALNDGTVARTIGVTGAGTLQLGSNASSLVDGTIVNITTGTLKSNNTSALGSLAVVNVTGTFSLGASQTVGALNGAGGTILNGNTLTVGNVTNNLVSAYSGVISDGTGSGALIKAGSNTLTFSGASANTYTGLTTVSAGILDLSKSASAFAISSDVGAGGLDKTTDVLINGGTLRFQTGDQLKHSITISITSGTLNFNNQNAEFYDLEASGGNVFYGTGTVIIDDPNWNGANNTVSGPTTFGFLNISAGTNTVTGASTGGAGLLTIGTATTSGPLTFSGNNNTPSLLLNADNTTPGTLRFASGLTVDLQFTGTGTSTGLISSSGAGTQAGRVDLNGSTRQFNIGDATGSATDMTISANIMDSAASGAGITKTGAGTLLLNATNAYTGTTAVSVGMLQVGDGTSGSINTSSGVTVASGATLGVNLANGGTLTPGITTAGTGGTAGTVNANGGNANTISGAIGGTGNFIQSGGGTTTLSNTNGYTGTTTVSAGVLAVTGSLSGTTAVQVNTGGTLLLSSSASVNSAATYTSGIVSTPLSGGTLKMPASSSGLTNTFASLTLNATSTLDYGSGNSNNTLAFTTVTGGTVTALTTPTLTLNVNNWVGNTYNPAGPFTDDGTIQDHFLIGTTDLFGVGTVINGISFGGTLPGMEIQFGGQYEIVPVPEPATTALIGSIALCALIGYRERRRFTGIRNRLAKK